MDRKQELITSNSLQLLVSCTVDLLSTEFLHYAMFMCCVIMHHLIPAIWALDEFTTSSVNIYIVTFPTMVFQRLPSTNHLHVEVRLVDPEQIIHGSHACEVAADKNSRVKEKIACTNPDTVTQWCSCLEGGVTLHSLP